MTLLVVAVTLRSRLTNRRVRLRVGVVAVTVGGVGVEVVVELVEVVVAEMVEAGAEVAGWADGPPGGAGGIDGNVIKDREKTTKSKMKSLNFTSISSLQRLEMREGRDR